VFSYYSVLFYENGWWGLFKNAFVHKSQFFKKILKKKKHLDTLPRMRVCIIRANSFTECGALTKMCSLNRMVGGFFFFSTAPVYAFLCYWNQKKKIHKKIPEKMNT
jgi:hypothetical protein